MKKCKSIYSVLMCVALVFVVLSWGVGQGWAQSDKELKYRGGRLTTAEKKAAAMRAAKLGLAPMAAAAPLPGIEGPGGVPHYFGPYANWAFSPLPKGPVATATVVDGGANYSTAPTVTINDWYISSCLVDSTPPCYTPASVTANVTGGAITGFTIISGGDGYSAPFVTIADPTGTGAIADAVIGGTLTGGITKFIDPLPALYDPRSGGTAPTKSIPLGVPDVLTYPGSHYYEIALQEYSESMHSQLPPTKLRGYVQINNGTNLYDAVTNLTGCVTAEPIPTGSHLCAAGDNNIAPAPIRYLGPVIVAQGRVQGIEDTIPAGKPTPVRIKFYNLLPTGSGGDLFLPVDESVPGSGLGPAGPGTAGSKYTQNRAAVHLHGNNTVWISDGNVHQWITPPNENTPYPRGVTVKNVPDMGTECDAPGSGCMTLFYTNAQSARLQFYHDHSMGITRLNVYAGEAGGYVITDAVEQDMIKGTNVTGINIAPGTTTPFKKVLPDIGIPLIIQDRTFVDAETIYAQDPTWNWGTAGPGLARTGDLWYPHVYMTVQNPWDLTGTNAFGRWHYGPWFNPPVPTCVNGLPMGCLEVGPVPNEYYQPVCDGLPDPVNLVCTTPWEPPLRPGVPNPSIPGESFLDTQMVNGNAYPYLEVEAKAVRFRVLNASNDRFVNLQLYVAADKRTPTTPGLPGTRLCNGVDVSAADAPANCTEVKMVPVSVAPANQYADTPSGIPDPGTKGPDWIMIGTEGGFMPKPIVIPSQPIGYNLDPAFFNFGVVNQHSLFLGAAERADVIVDFTGLADKTFILYNDSPAPVPAGAAPYDYYTGNANQMDAGGAPTTQPGYGPNTRTIMQIRVKAATVPTPDVNLANLEAVFAKGPAADKRGVFEVSQDPIIIPQAAFNSAYDAKFPTKATDQYVQINDTAKTFKPLGYDPASKTWSLKPAVTLPLEMKAMHDEMGGVYDTLYGRMSGMLGLSLPNSPNHVLIPYGLGSPPTDIVKGSLEKTVVGVLPDGTQIWRIFHNGVDTHPVHVHLFTAQLINRIGQDGQWYDQSQVDPSDQGWKETFKINPLEITYLAMRPTVPTPAQLPFEVPDSWRLIDPTLPEGATLIPPPPAGWFDPDGVAIPEILNHYVNFGWEYVWHCHILSHEEMDMMHSLVYAVPPLAPTGLVATATPQGNNYNVNLNWTDNSAKETGFTIQRATNDTFTQGLTTFNTPAAAGSGTIVAFTDTTIAAGATYWYRVYAIGPVVGDTQAYPGSLGFPTMSADSVNVNAVTYQPEPISVGVGAPTTTVNSPSNLQRTVQTGPQVSLTWRDNATNETGFVVERCTGVDCGLNVANFAQIATPGLRNNTGNVTYVDTTVTYGNTYSYRVKAVANAVSSGYTNTVDATVPAIPSAPTNLTVAIGAKQGNNYPATLTWVYTWLSPLPDPLVNFTIQRATNATFTTGLSTFTDTASPFNQNVNRNTTYYYRIRANNNIGGSSAWVNALPFPIRTGP